MQQEPRKGMQREAAKSKRDLVEASSNRDSNSSLSQKVARRIYDSGHGNADSRRPPFWLAPSGWQRGLCDAVVAVLILYSVVAVPLRIAFELEATPGSAEYVLEKIVDGFFVLDIVANFRTGVYSDAVYAGISYDAGLVARRYLRFWFWIDLFSTLDIADIARLMLGSSDDDNRLRATKLLRGIRLFRLLKLVRLFKLNKLVRRLEERGALPPTALRYISLVSVMLFMGHLLGCGLHMVTSFQTPSAACLAAQAAEPSHACEWPELITAGEGSPALSTRYISSLYWALAAMSTVGYGDLKPKNDAETGTVFAIELLGVACFGYVVGTVSSLTSKSARREVQIRQKMDFVSEYMRSHRLSRPMQRRIRAFYEYSFKHKPLLEVEHMMSELSTALQEELGRSLYGAYRSVFPQLLGRTPLSFLAWLGPRLLPFYATPGEYVQYAGVVGIDMFWLVRGAVDVLPEGAADATPPLYELLPGDTYGVEALLAQQRHEHSLRAKTFCDLLSLSHTHLRQAVRRAPQLRHQLKRLARAQAARAAEHGAARAARGPAPGGGAAAAALRERSASAYDGVPPPEAAPAPWYIIPTSSQPKRWWDLLVSLLILYSVLVVPVRIAFEQGCATDAWVALDWLVDGCFLLDILLSFFAAVEDDRQQQIVSLRLIARRYVRSPWFVIDFSSSVPWDKVVGAIMGESGCESAAGTQATRLLRVVRMVRLAKVMRVLRLQRSIRRLREELAVNPALMQLAAMLVYILFFVHIVGCVWFGITQFYPAASWADAYPAAAVGTNGTIAHAAPSAQYLASIYWAFTTISTIGYGDIVATNDAEKLLSLSVMALGSAIFGAILSRMTDLVAGIDVTASRKRHRMDVLNSWMAESSTPPWLFRRLRQYYFHYYDAGVDFGVQQQVLTELSPPLRTELLMYLNKEMVAAIPFFSHQPPAFVVSVCSVLRPCFALAYDYIFREGDVAAEMYFLQRGLIQLRCSTGEKQGGSLASAAAEAAEQQQSAEPSLRAVGRHEAVLDTQEAVSYFGEVPLLIALAEQGKRGAAARKAEARAGGASAGGAPAPPAADDAAAEAGRAFALLDADGSGAISPAELKALLAAPAGGEPPRWTGAEVDALVERHDQDRDGALAPAEFGAAWAEISPHLELVELERAGERRTVAAAAQLREASVLALSFCSLFSFSQTALSSLLEAYPGVMAHMESVARERMDKLMSMRTLTAVNKAAAQWKFKTAKTNPNLLQGGRANGSKKGSLKSASGRRSAAQLTPAGGATIIQSAERGRKARKEVSQKPGGAACVARALEHSRRSRTSSAASGGAGSTGASLAC